MRAKLLTSIALIGVLTLICAWPWILGPRPIKSDKAGLKSYLQRGFTLTAFTAGLLVLAGIGAIVIVRQARSDYKAASEANMRELLAGTAEAVRKKRQAVPNEPVSEQESNPDA